jgi:hypothetical protein
LENPPKNPKSGEVKMSPSRNSVQDGIRAFQPNFNPGLLDWRGSSFLGWEENVKNLYGAVVVVFGLLTACTATYQKAMYYQATPEQLMSAIERAASQLSPNGLAGEDYSTWQPLSRHERYLSFQATRPITRYLSNGQALTTPGDAQQLRFQFVPSGAVTGVSGAGDGLGAEADIAAIFQSLEQQFTKVE